MITIHVRIYGHLQHDAPEQKAKHTLEVTPGTKVAEVIESLGIPRAEVAFRLVNDKRVSDDHPLEDGDEVGLVPVIAGG